jgi:CIC family chloride channel protein
MHFFNPAPLMKLVEIIRAEKSSDAALSAAFEWAEQAGKQPVRANDTPGFIVNRVLVPTLGALVSGLLLARFFPDARGSGIPQTRAAIFIHDGRITLKTVVGKFVCCATSLASGIALGREGPSVHIGSGIASVVARRLGLSTAQVRWLIPVGASAALAAAFNTPIAAVLFSLEEIMGDLHAPVLGSVVLSSTTSWMVLHLVLGDEPLFHVAGYHLVSPVELLVYAMLPVLRNTYAGILSVDPAISEAATGLGMTARQRLWWVELPLALPVVLAGVRIATVVSIGLATIAAAIGAGGLGVLIYRGIAIVDNRQILAGAVPAALRRTRPSGGGDARSSGAGRPASHPGGAPRGR